MHFCYNLSISLYRIYMVAIGGILMPPLVPSHLNTLLSHIPCHMPAVELQALMLALKKGGHPIWSEVKEKRGSCFLVPCGPGRAAQVRTELQL